jgi:hypothetical protein
MKLRFNNFTKADSLSTPRLAWQLRFQQEIGMRTNFVPSIHLPIGQTFAFNFLQAVHRAFAVCHFSAVMAMVKLCEIQRQMLFADMMKCPNNAALEQREKSFDSVGGDEPVLFAPDIFLRTVLDDVVIELRFKSAIGKIVVGVHVGANRHVVFDDLLEILSRHMAHDLAANLAASFKQGNNGNFVVFASTTDALLFAANVGFVHFDRPRKFFAKRGVFQSKPNPMRHEKCGAIAAKFQVALQLKRANALFGAANQIPSNEPFAERNFAGLENCSDGDGELLFAVGAPAKSGADFRVGISRNRRKLGLVGAFAMRAKNAVFPADALKMLACGIIGRKLVNNLNQCQVFGLFLFHAQNI